MKSLGDRVLAFFLIILFSPFIVITALLVYFGIGRPILFKQVRPGFNEKLFTIYKFRTMTDARDEQGELLPDEKRLTSIGKFIRKTSLDELPQLFNVLKGDMSFVGPRPLLVEYLKLYNKEQRRRHNVKPGITGWAQVNGRNTISWEERFKYDVWYVDNQSLLLDLKILWLTLKKVIKKEDVVPKDGVIMKKFIGNK